ncbi:beta-L-arabinofuranosidase domain-containing protein [Actinoplanes rectilineatus]|uniref:beta-L-arabinofuranosidase domain-containing protein n=1 Tax=Actinoplanes rectilineatus TaxID=113571 RepID=UPI0005F2C8B8|nr:beta-L-arabinofuranosidase domain-containing protein [Actinoplanes rectilineatus]
MAAFPISRRQLMQSAAAVAGAALTGPALKREDRPRVNGLPVPASWQAVPFGLDQVDLGDSVFTAKRNRMLAYARAYPADRILSNFRAAAGLDTFGAEPPGGWDDATGNLRGHYSGHFLSLLAQAWAGTGDTAFKDKLDQIVHGLDECQTAWDARVGLPGTPPPAPSWTGGGLTLTGDGQYVGLPDGTVDGLTDFTITVRVRITERRTWSRVFDFGTGTGVNMFLTADAGSGPRFAITTTGSAGEQRITGSAPLPLDQWVHLAVTRKGSTGSLYVNGTVAGTNPGMTLSPADLGAPKNNWIGRSQYGDAYFTGVLDDFQLFDRALSADELTTATGNLVSYRFDETAGTTVADSSGRSWDAAVITGAGGAPGPSHAGFLAAYPETQFIQLEQYVTYPAIWAPYYTCHKIMRGLLDAYTLAGNGTALRIVQNMGLWVHSRLSVLPREQLDRMWSLYIAGEYGGMNEVMADLFALTGDDRFLVTARCFDNTALLAACVSGTDTLDGRHANQHIPQFLGYLRMFENGQGPDYRTAAANFFDMVVPHRTYVHGGTGQGEVFRKRDAIAASIVTTTNAESCAAYNMLKVARNLFLHAPDAAFFDYYEKTLVNQILGSRRDADSTEDPLVTYMVPVGPGVRRDYGNIGTCCGGTGLENHTKYQDSIYFRSARGDVLYVNLFLPSTLRWTARGLTITQTGSWPSPGATTLTVTGNGLLDLRLRIPSWARDDFSVTLNDKVQRVRVDATGYVSLRRQWRSGDRVGLTLPFRLRIERALDDPSLQALLYGPLALIAKSAQSSYLPMSWYGSLPLTGDLAEVVKPGTAPLTFRAGEVEFGPFHIGDTAAYHAYFRRDEPRIVFFGVDSGVPNRPDPTGTTFLDRLWSSAPFAGRRTFQRAVTGLTRDWQAAGLLTEAEVTAVRAVA